MSAHLQMRPSDPLDDVAGGINWRWVLPALATLIGLTVLLYWHTASTIVLIWARSETFTHGFLVPPITAWLIWRRRDVLAKMSPNPSLWGLVLLAGVALVWLLGDLSAVNALTQLALVGMLVLLVPSLLGWQVTRAIIFPLGFLFFAVPIGEFAMPQLMVWTADFTVEALRLSGIPVYREGLQFVIPSGNWSVVEACSGVRYLIASVTVGTLFAYLNYQSTQRRLLFVAVSIVVPVLANWLRAYIIVMLGHFSGNKLATGVDHLVYGWVFFGVVIMLMFMVGARWAEPDQHMVPGSVGLAGSRSGGSITGFGFATVCFVALLGLPHFVLGSIDRSESAVTGQILQPMAVSSSWQALAISGLAFKPSFQNPTTEVNQSFSSQGAEVGLYLGYYLKQTYDRKLVSSTNVLVSNKDSGWAWVKNSQRSVLLQGQPVFVRSAELRGSAPAGQSTDLRLVAWQIYWVNGTLTASDYLAKVYSAVYRLLGRGDDSAVIVIYTPREPGSAAGAPEATLQRFLDANFDQINQILVAARRQK